MPACAGVAISGPGPAGALGAATSLRQAWTGPAASGLPQRWSGGGRRGRTARAHRVIGRLLAARNSGRLRVVQLIGSPRPGGAETYFLRLVRALAAEVEILVVARRGSWVAARARALGLPLREVGFRGSLDLLSPWRIAQILRAFEADVAQSWMSRATAALPKRPGVPVIARLGGYYPLKYYHRADWLCANTEDIAGWLLRQGAPRERVVVVPNMAPRAVVLDTGLRRRTRQRLGLGEADQLLLAAGRLHQVKAFDVAIEALRALPEHVHLVIAGEGLLHDDLRLRAERGGLAARVHLVGWQDELAPWIAAADLWLVPSREEPLGNTVLDAWAHGRPVVATDAIGPRGLIREGVDGLLVPRDDPAALAAQAARILADPGLATRLVEAGRQRVEGEFAPATIVGRWRALYERAIAAGPGGR